MTSLTVIPGTLHRYFEACKTSYLVKRLYLSLFSIYSIQKKGSGQQELIS